MIGGRSSCHHRQWMSNATESRRTILVVEDDPDVRDTLVLILSRFGYDARPASDGARALALVRDGLRPDLVILDQWMPNVDGVRFRAMQAEETAIAAVPTIVITASDRCSASLAAGVVASLRKPFEVGALLSAVQAALST